jgi:hypothetical protein
MKTLTTEHSQEMSMAAGVIRQVKSKIGLATLRYYQGITTCLFSYIFIWQKFLDKRKINDTLV